MAEVCDENFRLKSIERHQSYGQLNAIIMKFMGRLPPEVRVEASEKGTGKEGLSGREKTSRMESTPVEMGLNVPAKYTTGFRYPNPGRQGVPRDDHGMW